MSILKKSTDHCNISDVSEESIISESASKKGTATTEIINKYAGNEKSGNWGHLGIPGKSGGSQPGGGSAKMGTKAIPWNWSRAMKEAKATESEVNSAIERNMKADDPNSLSDRDKKILDAGWGGSRWREYTGKQ